MMVQTYLAVAEKLVPVLLLEWLMAKMAEELAVDSIDPHVVVVGVNHQVEHMVAINVAK